ncbi:YbaB/EbfC family nucleoid-associated protein [Amycolatopsis pigmentata]|uniref:YbaB/EbfC family nucleoid-associated protein n=1 Tax=Amycolatopsis pigmentata TaxID=450801 RepID=A0ABW5G3T1_9PSEU
MTESPWSELDKGIEEAMANLEREREKLGKLGELWQEERTTVRAKDQSLEMTFDGRGEPVELVFNPSKYRTLAPAQLADVILETFRRGRARSVEKMSATMGETSRTGLNIGDVASGKVDPREMLDALIAPMLGGLDLPNDKKSRGEGS